LGRGAEIWHLSEKKLLCKCKCLRII
jgi:hypothetical protein